MAEHSFQVPMPNLPLLLNYSSFGASFSQGPRLTTEVFILAFWLGCLLLPWQRSWLKTRLIKWFLFSFKNPVVRLFLSFAHYELTLNPFCQHYSNKILTQTIFVILRKSFSVLLKIHYVKIQIFRDRSFAWFVNYFLPNFLKF